MKTHPIFDPAAEMAQMARTLDRLFEGFAAPGPATRAIPIDIFETDRALVVRAAVPGVRPEDLELTIENQVMTLRGETRDVEETRDAKLYRREIQIGAFARSLRLPEKLDLGAVDAAFDHGVVTVTLPKLPEAQPTTVRVRVRGQQEAEALPAHIEPKPAEQA